MSSSRVSRWLAACGVLLIAAIAADSLVPVQWQVRLGLHWLIEHFLVYFAATSIVCLAWPRPFIAAGALMVLAGVMEALQGLTADRVPDLPTALCGAAGVMTAALIVQVIIALRRRVSRAQSGQGASGQALARTRQI
jgi:VanZ family protein